MCDNPAKEDRVSGICGGYGSDDVIATTRKDSQTAERVQTCQQSRTSNRQAVSPPYRHDDILYSGSTTSPTTLQGPSEIETGGSGTLPGRLRPCNPIVSSGTTRFGMVDNATPTQCQPAYSPSATSDVFGDRCFHDRLGSSLPQHQDRHRGAVVQGGVHSSHKLVGAESCLPCCSVLCTAAAQLPHSDILGQPSSSGLYKQDGRNTLPEALRPCSGNVGVVHREEVDRPCGTPAGEVQCYSRFRVETSQRFQRLATQSQGVQGTRSSLWPYDSGSLCILQEHTTDNFLQLETRPQGISDRCTCTTLDSSSTVHVPSLCLNRSVLAEDPQRGGSLCPPGGTNMAVADMVPTGTGDVGGSTSNLPNSDNLLLNSQSEPHPLVIQGHLTLAAWPISGDPCRIKDFRKGLLTSYVPPGEKGQRNHTIQLGGDGFAGVVQGKSIQFLPPW